MKREISVSRTGTRLNLCVLFYMAHFVYCFTILTATCFVSLHVRICFSQLTVGERPDRANMICNQVLVVITDDALHFDDSLIDALKKKPENVSEHDLV